MEKQTQKKETKLQELERRILVLEGSKTIYINFPPNGSAGYTPQCTCNLYPNSITRPPCPLHGMGYPMTYC